MKKKQKTQIKKLHIVAAVIVAVVASVFASLFALASMPFSYIPSELTNTIVNEKQEDKLFIYEITRIPALAQTRNPELNEEEMKLTVGISGDIDVLNFGLIPTGGSYVGKYLNLTNRNENPVKISLSATGNISPYIEFDKNNFILKNQDTTIYIIFRTTGDMPIGNYTGEVDVIVKRARFSTIGFLMV